MSKNKKPPTDMVRPGRRITPYYQLVIEKLELLVPKEAVGTALEFKVPKGKDPARHRSVIQKLIYQRNPWGLYGRVRVSRTERGTIVVERLPD